MPTDKGKLRPTVIDPSALTSSIDVGSRQASPIGQPTTIPGVERKRIVVSYSELQTLSPGLANEVYKKALALLSTLIAEKVTEREAILWGHDVQTSYSQLVDQILKMSQKPVLEKVQGYLNRMITLLSSIDVLAVCGYDSSGIFGQFTKSMNLKVDTPQELRQAQGELAQLVQLINKALNELLNLKDQLEQVSSQLDEISENLEAFAIAALFLAEFYSGSTIAQRFTERSMNLTQSVALIGQDDAIREIQIEQPLKLIGIIQNVVLVSMPGLMGSIASIMTLMQSRVVSPTEAGEVVYQLQETIQQLQSP